MGAIDSLKFIVDQNAGKLTKWLRAMGYDTLFFDSGDDSQMIATALKEGRVVITRDTNIVRRHVVTSGRVKVILLESDEPEKQLLQVINTLKLDIQFRPFSICLECNQPLLERSKTDVKGRVPPYVFKTQEQYMECPVCNRIYWKGTHWKAMTGRLAKLKRR